MATLTPPTHTEYFAPPGQDRLWSRVPYQRANTILVDVDAGTVSRYPGAEVVDGDALIAAQADNTAYAAPFTWTDIPADVETLLVTAGYEDVMDDGSYPAWL